MRKALVITIMVMVISMPHGAAGQASGVKAFFRDGQTFLTWESDNAIKSETYHVYRSKRPITTQDLASHNLIATVPEGSSRFEEMWSKDGKNLLQHKQKQEKFSARVIPRLCIEDAGDGNKAKMLSENLNIKAIML